MSGIIYKTWIYFVSDFETYPNSRYVRKTETWTIRSKQGDGIIGHIKWYGPWRKYCFFPQMNTVFEQKCLRDISDFLDEKMTERKVKAVAEKGKISDN